MRTTHTFKYFSYCEVAHLSAGGSVAGAAGGAEATAACERGCGGVLGEWVGIIQHLLSIELRLLRVRLVRPERTE